MSVSELVMTFGVKNAVSSIRCCRVLLATMKRIIQFEGDENRVLRRTWCLDLRGRKLH